jgi:hypothetical protein
MQFSELQQLVFDAAKKQLETETWFRGICTDGFPTDDEILCDGIEESASTVCCETAYWDAPDLGA